MKKIMFFVCLFFIGSMVYAEKFTIGDYIEGEYVRMVGKEKTKNLNVQKIIDSNGKFVYCLEPFILVDEEKEDYEVFKRDLSNYKNLTPEQVRKVSLLAFYGYGYKNRTSPYWYAVTQLLIWRTVDPESEFYFTDTKGGEKIIKHNDEINELIADVYDHDVAPKFIKPQIVNYQDDLYIKGYSDAYNVITDNYEYKYEPSYGRLTVKNVTESGVLKFVRNSRPYIDEVTIYSSDDSQDLIRPGILNNTIYEIPITVTKGQIGLDIRKDTSDVYSVESDFSNTCYEIIDEGGKVIDLVCSNKKSFIHYTSSLPYGEYIIKQVSVGKGYKKDEKVYTVKIDSDEVNLLLLSNNLIKNRIELSKWYCYNDNCSSEENAVFNVYDVNGRLVSNITTDENGYGFLEVGYGSYSIVQDKGLDNYTFVDSYEETIVDDTSVHYKELYNYLIEEEVTEFEKPEDKEEPKEETEEPIEENKDSSENIETDGSTKEEEVIEEKPILDEEIKEEVKKEEVVVEETVEEIKQEEVLPPKTGTYLAGIIKILYNVIVIIICSCKFKDICYNN